MSDERAPEGSAPWSAPGRVPDLPRSDGHGRPLGDAAGWQAPRAHDRQGPRPSAGTPPGDASAGDPAGADVSPFATRAEERDRVLAGPGYSSTRLHNDGVAVAAMVFGVIGIVVPGLCLVAIALGHVALRRLKTSYAGGGGLAVAGLVLGYGGLVLWLALLLFFSAMGMFLA